MPFTCTVSVLALSVAKPIDQPAGSAVFDGKVTVRLDIGELKFEITEPQSAAVAA